MVVVVGCSCYFGISCCDVVDGGSNDYRRADEVFSTKDMMAPTLKLKTPMEIKKKQQACGLWFVCWFVGFVDFLIVGFLVCWFVGLLLVACVFSCLFC